MLLLIKVFGTGLLPYLKIRQGCAHCFALFIPALFVDGNEACKTHALVSGAEGMAGTLGVDGHSVKNGIGHLRCQEPAPDQLVKLILVRGQAAPDPVRIQLHMGGTDGFMGILGICLGLKHMERAVIILFSVSCLDKICSGQHCLVRQTERVGTHVGDET